jgi:hypothetical protein
LEVRLADAEIDDILAVALQFRRARQNLECRFGPQPLQVWHELQHGASLQQRFSPATFAHAADQKTAPVVGFLPTNSRSEQRRKAWR